MLLTKEQRAEISRANGRKSRGPKTAKGKSFSSRNACKHGLASGAALDHAGVPKAERIRTVQLVKALCPQNDLELAMVRQIASDQVLIRQIEKIEYPYLAAATTAIELGRALVRFDRYKARAENRSRRLQFRLLGARSNKNSTKRT